MITPNVYALFHPVSKYVRHTGVPLEPTPEEALQRQQTFRHFLPHIQISRSAPSFQNVYFTTQHCCDEVPQTDPFFGYSMYIPDAIVHDS